jgi:tetrahydromethanopterin S-methyltransferase subunit B
MHPQQIAERKGQANQRIEIAVEKLAKKFKVELDTGALNQTRRDPAIADMLKTEAMADILEALAEKTVKSNKPTTDPVIDPAPEV